MAAGGGKGMGYGQHTLEFGIERTDRDTRRQRQLSQEAVDKIIYDIMSSDKGLASLATGENLSGGFGATTKGLLAQDMITKLAGEIAMITAPEVTEEHGKKKHTENEIMAGGSSPSVICTELNRQKYLSDDLYYNPIAEAHFYSLPVNTYIGYLSWAIYVVPLLRKSPKLCKILAPIIRARYSYVVTGRWNLLGWLTISVGQPVCWMIGALRRKHYAISVS